MGDCWCSAATVLNRRIIVLNRGALSGGGGPGLLLSSWWSSALESLSPSSLFCARTNTSYAQIRALKGTSAQTWGLLPSLGSYSRPMSPAFGGTSSYRCKWSSTCPAQHRNIDGCLLACGFGCGRLYKYLLVVVTLLVPSDGIAQVTKPNQNARAPLHSQGAGQWPCCCRHHTVCR